MALPRGAHGLMRAPAEAKRLEEARFYSRSFVTTIDENFRRPLTFSRSFNRRWTERRQPGRRIARPHSLALIRLPQLEVHWVLLARKIYRTCKNSSLRTLELTGQNQSFH
jgi:hypothetical protein